MGKLKETFNKSDGFQSFLEQYLDFYVDILSQLKKQNLNPLVEVILKAHKEKKKIILMGNGGSAANATHISTGLSYITRNWDTPLKSISLAADPVLMSSLSNDFSYEDVFYHQLKVQMDPGDVIIALSVSGKSKNILKAARFAREAGNPVIALSGSDGGELKALSTFSVHLKADETLLGVTEDIHMVVGHALTYYLEFYFQAASV